MSEENNKKVVVEITLATVAKTVLLLILLYTLYTLRDLVLVVLTAVMIATAIEPFTKWFTERKIPRVLAALLIYLMVFASVAAIIFFFVPPILQDITDIKSHLPAYLASLDVFNSAPIQGAIQTFSLDQVFPAINQTIQGLTGGFFEAASVIFGGVFSFGLIVVFSFYLVVQEKGIENVLRILTPLRYEPYMLNLWARSRKKIGLWMQGQIILGFIVGVFAYLGLTIFGVKYALLLAILAAVFELIPVFGPVMSDVPAVVFASTQSIGLGVVVLCFYIIIQQFENHLIYPLVVRKVVGVPPLVSIFALLVGGRLAGFLGILISMPIATIIMELVDDFEKRKYPKVGP
jgi:predicted PurR-regulated permease PerM